MDFSRLFSVVGVLVLLSLIAPLRHARRLTDGKGEAPPSIPPPQGAAEKFHQAEFTALKAEIAELLKNVASNFQYATIGSAGIIAWALTQGSDHKIAELALTAALWLPFTLACFLLSLSVTQYIRISEIGCYLWRLEGAFSSQELGWEEFFHRRRQGVVGFMYAIGWASLLIGDAVVGWFGVALIPRASSLPI